MTSSLHQHTPSLTVIDPRGLSVRGIAYHRREVEEAIAARVQRQVFNAQRHLVQQWDPRLLELSESEAGVQPNQSTRYSLNGQVLLTESVDAGWRVSCHDAAGLLRNSWDGRDTQRRYAYDELMRPVSIFEHAPELCVERFTYAGADDEDAFHNRCGQLLRYDDPAGSLWHETFALIGQPLSEARQFCTALTSPHWPESEADLEDTPYTTRWRHDALGAVIEQIDALEHVQRFEFDVAGHPFASWLDDVALLKSTTYNAFGHVEIEWAGNDVTTTAYYSARDGLLSNLKAKRSDGKTLQDMHYQYDPVGNITRIEDLAQPVQWFAGQRIQAVSTYTYDTLYQLISATGRESTSQIIGPGLPGLEIFGPIDDSRWRNYNQTYTYDSGGNLTQLKHDAGAGNGYTREMIIDTRSNRSLFKDGSPIDFAKDFDANGNQQYLAPGQCMQWDTRNQLQQVTQVQRDEPNGQDDDTETYVYDGGGQRVRKVRRAKTRGGEHISEVRYLPGLEIRCRTVGQQLHVVIAQAGRNSVRLLNWDDGRHQHRYSLSDHLGSSTLEVDQASELISQESYYPHGGTAWWAARSAIDANYKTVRYSGKERDATGLYYYGLRYYAPWWQRWINPDPAGDVDGLNRYRFVRNNPVTLVDLMGLSPWNRKDSNTAKDNAAGSADRVAKHTDEAYRLSSTSVPAEASNFDPTYLTDSAISRGPWKPSQVATLMTWAALEPTQKLVHMVRWHNGQLFSGRADEVFSSWDIFSTSLIDLKHLDAGTNPSSMPRRTGAIGEVGFILKVPPQNIVGVHEKDISFEAHIGMWTDPGTFQREVQSPYALADYVKDSDTEGRPVRSDTLMTPTQVLEKTEYSTKYSHNEILVSGRAGLSLYQDLKPTESIEVEHIIVMPYEAVSNSELERILGSFSRLNPAVSMLRY